MFAPSEPTRFGSAMKIHKCIFAALTSLTFHVKQFPHFSHHNLVL